MAQHAHKFTIGDDAAAHALLNKLTKNGSKQGSRAKLLRALDDAARHYGDSNQKVAGVLSRVADRVCGGFEGALTAAKAAEAQRHGEKRLLKCPYAKN
ncbi:MAG: hypothetical protein WA690_15480 [Candidatus Acidiferrales bacterium]